MLKSQKRVFIYCVLALILLFGVVLAIAGFSGAVGGLHAELVVRNTDIGIPGISKMYEARVVNRSVLPISVSRCDYIDDASQQGTMLAYAVERWDNATQAWKTVIALSESDFCKPYPLGITRAQIKTGLLWPGQSISTGEEATAARNAFLLGDRARFVVFLSKAGDYSRAIATSDIVLDEHPRESGQYRIRH
jgi:hypothetical protein